jgi:prophage maintenance system killer protein
VSSINSSYFGSEAYTTPEEKVVAYLYFLIKNHPLTDGNKRTASLSFVIICDLNDLEPKYEDFTLDELVVFIEKIQEQDYQIIIKTLSDILFKPT